MSALEGHIDMWHGDDLGINMYAQLAQLEASTGVNRRPDAKALYQDTEAELCGVLMS